LNPPVEETRTVKAVGIPGAIVCLLGWTVTSKPHAAVACGTTGKDVTINSTNSETTEPLCKDLDSFGEGGLPESI